MLTISPTDVICNLCKRWRQTPNLFNTPASIQLWRYCQLNVHQRAGWAQNYSSWVLNAYTFIAQKVAILHKNSKYCIINVFSKIRFAENVLKYMQPEPRFRGYSMNTLNIRRCPCKLDSALATLLNDVTACMIADRDTSIAIVRQTDLSKRAALQ